MCEGSIYMIQLFFAIFQAVALSIKEYEQNLERERKLDMPRISDSDEEILWKNAALTQRGQDASLDGDSDFNSTMNEMYPKLIWRGEEDVPPTEDTIEKTKKLEEMKKKLNEALGTREEVKGLTDKDMWKRLHDYLVQNFNDFLVNGHLGVEMQIRYFLCCYVVVFLPMQTAFFVPAIFFKWIPRSSYKTPVLNDALKGLEIFLQFVRKESQTTFLISFVVGRKNMLKEDLQFILDIPQKILSDPAFIIREFLGFEIRARGLNKFKKSVTREAGVKLKK
eukprot:jgi/Antlo1/1993/2213